MGKTYASLHIRTADRSGLIPLIKDFAVQNGMFNNVQPKFTNIFSSPAMVEKFETFMKMSNPVIVTVFSDYFVSYYDETFSIANIEAYAKEISFKTDCAVMFTSRFDEDVFSMGVVQKNKLITRLNVGGAITEHGLVPASLNPGNLLASLKISGLSGLSMVNTNNISKVEDLIEVIMRISVSIKHSVIDYEAKIYELLKSDGNIRIYQKKQ